MYLTRRTSTTAILAIATAAAAGSTALASPTVATLRPAGATAVTAATTQALPAFSTTPKSSSDPSPSRLTQLWRLRTGEHASFDRIVLDERFSHPGYSVHYVKQVLADPSGKPVALKGRYFLQVTVHNAATDGAAGAPTYIPDVRTPLLPEVRQIKKTGEFENVVSFGIGLSHYRGFRVFRLSSPLRLVIDVRH